MKNVVLMDSTWMFGVDFFSQRLAIVPTRVFVSHMIVMLCTFWALEHLQILKLLNNFDANSLIYNFLEQNLNDAI
jgi:hypothetical protein